MKKEEKEEIARKMRLSTKIIHIGDNDINIRGKLLIFQRECAIIGVL